MYYHLGTRNKLHIASIYYLYYISHVRFYLPSSLQFVNLSLRDKYNVSLIFTNQKKVAQTIH